MSLINDALKRAQESQKKNSPSGAAPLRPIENAARGIGWILPAAVILFLAAAGIFIVLALHKNKTPAVAIAPKPIAIVSAPAAVTPAPATNIPPNSVANADLPKLQGIMFDATRPVAILNGQSVYVGDHAGVFQVKEITQNSVTLEAADGSQKTLQLGQ